ncbi:hypothetical protein SAMN05192565_103192 [Methylobacterium gossipiicola]|uniref:Uncharacterized protein n=1 Tax=Methylobacterium gossipiicola TaxID=582675 RepID=A0A1I2S3E4_9HYPH|nr:hypothetical protein SAMN05192565_103192 [Methylobacterium gossipiicola]
MKVRITVTTSKVGASSRMDLFRAAGGPILHPCAVGPIRTVEVEV